MDRTAVTIPGRLFGPYQPLLFYAALAAQARGGAVEALDWNAAESPAAAASPGARQAWVRDQVAPVLDRLGGRPVLIGKSLGTYAADLAAQRGLPAIWYTPLLLDELVVASLRASTAPFLLIGGTADTGAWDGALARSLTRHVCEIPDADHGLMVPAGLAASAAVLGEVTAAERFLDEVVWPAWARRGGLAGLGSTRWSGRPGLDEVVRPAWARRGGLAGLGSTRWFGQPGLDKVAWPA